MAAERSVEEVLDRLLAQAIGLWGTEDAERQRQALRQTAEEITCIAHYALPPDLEPQFF